MAVKIEFETSNAMFAETSLVSREDEIARILREIADKVQNCGIGSGGGTIRDSNGNRIGSWEATIDAEDDYHSPTGMEEG